MTYAKDRFEEIANSIDEARHSCNSAGEYIDHLLALSRTAMETIAEVRANYPSEEDWLGSSDDWQHSDC